MKKVVAALVALALVFMVIVAVLIATGHASTTSDHRGSSLGVLEVYQNPYTYLVAVPVDGQILEEKYTNIRFWPYATDLLYDETVLFCGDVTPAFDNKTGVLVITYRTRASHLYKGLSCHDIVSVFEVKSK
jgi:hypothetical protein